MGNLQSLQDWNLTPEQIEHRERTKHLLPHVLKLNVKEQMCLIINNWIRQYDMKFDVGIITLIIDLFLYQQIFDTERTRKIEYASNEYNIKTNFSLLRPGKGFIITIIGNDGVGRSTLWEKYFPGVSVYTSESGRKTIKINGEIITLTVWSPHQLKYYSLKCMTFRPIQSCHGVILMYDVNNRQSFDDIQLWNNHIIQYRMESSNPIKKLLIGNKVDLNESVVSFDEAKQLCQKLDIDDCMEMSASNDENAESALSLLVKRMMAPYKRMNTPFIDIVQTKSYRNTKS